MAFQKTTKHGLPISGGFFSLFQLPPTIFRPSFLIDLGKAMTLPQSDYPNTTIPAGYTYFGQFVVHDISRLARGDDPPQGSLLNIGDLLQLRTASFDLDSVYGDGFDDQGVAIDRATGEMLLGAGQDENGNEVAGIDLPRDPDGGKPLIGDDRNDENLLVAQLHLQFLKLHNFFVWAIHEQDASDGLAMASPEQVFLRARLELQLHYQQVVLYDFLRRVLDEKVWTCVIHKNQGATWDPERHEAGRIPVELAAAALRFGHSIVQHSYIINDLQVTLDEFFSWTGGKELSGTQKLPLRLYVDWQKRFFSDFGGEYIPKEINSQRRILPHLKMRRNAEPNEEFDLAAHNLLRGNDLGLPDAQTLVKHLACRYPELVAEIGLILLTPDEVLSEPPKQVRLNPQDFPDLANISTRDVADSGENFLTELVYAQELSRKTPLWFYILQESWVRHEGKRLGPLGSLIVAESMRALAITSEPSIFESSGWESRFIEATLEHEGEKYLQMTDLLRAVQSYENQAIEDNEND